MSDAQTTQLVADVIVKILGAIALAALSYAGANWGVAKGAEKKLDRQTFLGDLARQAVQGAAQALDGQAGEEKKAWAVDFMQRAAETHGIKVTPLMREVMSGLIEAALHQVKAADALPERVVTPATIATLYATPAAASGAAHPAARLAATPQGGATA